MWATYICQTRVHSRLMQRENSRTYNRTIDVAGQITGNEHEAFGGIAEAIMRRVNQATTSSGM